MRTGTAFQQTGFQPKPGEAYRKISWVDLTCRETGGCSPQELQRPKGLDLYNPQFSPDGYRLLMPGVNYASGSGAGDIFLVEFSSEGIPGKVVNLSNTDQINESFPHWNPKTGQAVALCPLDMPEAKKALRIYDPVSGERQEGALIVLNNPQEYQVFPQGNRGVILNINPSAGVKGVFELRLFDFDGTAGPALANSRGFDGFSISKDGNFLVYLEEQSTRLALITLQTGTLTSVYQAKVSGSLSWMGWAK